MSYCTRIAEITGGESPPLFKCLKVGEKSYCKDISFSSLNAIEAFLNSLHLGVFSVAANDEDYTITTECNGNSLTSVTVVIDEEETEINFSNSDCQDQPCNPCDENCFDDLVGLEDVCSPSDSCIFLNRLGISRYTLEQIITKDYSGPKDFFLKQYRFTVQQVSQSLHSFFANKYNVASIIEGQRLGFHEENKHTKTANNKISGIYSKLINTNSFLDYYVSELSLFTDYTGDIQVNVYDILQGRRIDVIIVPSVAGQISTVSLDNKYKSRRKGMRLFFGYDTTGINSYKTLIRPGICCGNTSTSNQYISSQGAYSNAGTFIDSDLKSSEHTFGMSLTYSLQCNHNDWLCSHKNLIALPIAYKLAANIIQFALSASPGERVNTKVTINKEENERQWAWFESKFNETFSSVTENIQTPTDAKCFSCKTPNRTKLVLP